MASLFRIIRYAVAGVATLATLLQTLPAQAGGCGCPTRCYCEGDVTGPMDRVTDLDQQQPAGDLDLGFQESFAALTGNNVALMDAGYIDNAVIGTQMRSRFDAAYNNPLPDRAEFFYAMCGCFNPGRGPGPPLAETEVDYQETSTYFELALNERFSGFVEAPYRYINPEVNANERGFSDLMAGFKYALMACPTRYLTFQFRVYTPTGDGREGLGTEHVSLEPALLYWNQLNDRWGVFAEFRDWIPISDSQVNGQDFAGNVLRYGLGTSYNIMQCCDGCNDRRLALVTEFVGWTVLDGLALDGSTTNGPFGGATLIDVSGDTMVNAKVGLRYTLNSNSVYAGYGRALTGDVWYEDILRLEYRRVF